MNHDTNKALIDQVIDQLLTVRIVDVIKEAMRGLGQLEDAFDTDEFRLVHSWVQMYNSVNGPFGGIGAAALTDFRMTVIYSRQLMVLFANDRLYGFAPFSRDVLQHRRIDAFTRVDAPPA